MDEWRWMDTETVRLAKDKWEQNRVKRTEARGSEI